jgi:Arc/MetJ-type ribon-helix-helix transcriptional regulator
MPRKPLVVTFRLDEATRDRIREAARYSPYRDASAFIRAAISELLRREADRPSGWTVRRDRRLTGRGC